MAPDGFDRDGDPEARNSAGKEASVLKHESGCGPCRLDYTSPSKKKKVDEDSSFHDNQPAGFQFGENIKRQVEIDGQIPLSPDNKGKHFARKSAKESIAIPSKRTKIDDSENCMKNNGSNGHEDISSISGFDPIRCTADKSQIIIQKRVHDGKRADKKNCRASIKNKYESLASKAGLVCSDSFSSGNNILGSHGLKSDIHEIAKQLDELSLFDLLNGNYKYSAFPVDKGKKSASTNDALLHSVRKVCSILCPSPHVLAENSSNLKACQGSQDPSFSTGNTSDYEAKDKQLEESLTKGKVLDTFQPDWIKSTMYQPKKILDQLLLPVAHELESFFLISSDNSVPSQFTRAKSCCGTNLAPFHWSFSHPSNSKPSVESCKVNATKNACQAKWARIGRCSSLTVDDKNFLPGLVLTSCGDDTDLLNQQKIDNVLEWMKSSTFQPPGGLSNKFSILGTHAEAQVEENMNLVDRSGLLGPFNSKAFHLHEVYHSSRLECNFKVHAPQEGTTSVVSSCPNEMNLDPSKFNLTFKDKVVLKDHPAGTIDGSQSSFHYTCRNATAQSCDSSCRYCRILKCKQVYPQEILSAAATLMELGGCPNHMSPVKCSSGRNRWPKAPSMKKMKARKSSTSINNPDRSFAATGCNNLIRKANVPFAEHQPAIQRKMDFILPSSSGRESLRWSSSPNKAEKDLNQRVQLGNNSFRPLLTPFSSRAADKVCDNLVKEPNAKPPSVAFKGSPIRDWIRCKNKRF